MDNFTAAIAHAVPEASRWLSDRWYRARHMGVLASSSAVMRAFHYALAPDAAPPSRAEVALLRHRYARLLDEDLRDADDGIYPRALVEGALLTAYARAVPALLGDVPRLVARGRRGRADDLPPSVDRTRYPAYYLRTFHWQTDGWLSRRSARVYDLGVEALFGGTADVMRRRALRPLVDSVRGCAQPRILDIACGTGRLLGQLRRALPRAALYGVDLSQPYLSHARESLGDDEAINLVRENAEALPFADATFDAAVSVYLFHELPRDARRNVCREARRVLGRGGRFVVIDADQPHASPALEQMFAQFPRVYHEPYFASYQRDPIEGVLEACGFVVESAREAFLSRMVVGRVP